jgi:hypothetical protein
VNSILSLTKLLFHLPSLIVRATLAVAAWFSRPPAQLALLQSLFEPVCVSMNLCLIHQEAASVFLLNGQDHRLVNV